jgi:cytochrome c553
MSRIAAFAALCATALIPQLAAAQTAAAPTAPAPAASAPAAAPAGDPMKGAQKVAMCQGCHGILGWRTAYPEVYRVPKIAGQNAQYIVAALKEYKSGNRGHPTMRAIAGSLSDADMADVAAYYSQTPLSTAMK